MRPPSTSISPKGEGPVVSPIGAAAPVVGTVVGAEVVSTTNSSPLA